MSKALVIAVHPDDETLGCGGTMLKLVSSGYDLYWLILTEAKQGTGWSDDIILARDLEIQKVQSSFSIKKLFKLGFQTTQLDAIPIGDLIKEVSKVLQEVSPEVVFLPNHTDIHSDHKIGFQASFSACKNFRAPFIQKILMYECLSETEYGPPLSGMSFTPNTFIDISDYFNKKVETMGIYKSEILPSPFPRSPEIIEALASFRGSRIGVKYAEAFTLLFNTQL